LLTKGFTFYQRSSLGKQVRDERDTHMSLAYHLAIPTILPTSHHHLGKPYQHSQIHAWLNSTEGEAVVSTRIWANGRYRRSDAVQARWPLGYIGFQNSHRLFKIVSIKATRFH